MIAEVIMVSNSLIELDLSTLGIGAEETKVLADALKMNMALTKLYLSFNQAGREGAIMLAEMLTLKFIDLAYNKIGEQGAEAIFAAFKAYRWFILEWHPNSCY